MPLGGEEDGGEEGGVGEGGEGKRRWEEYVCVFVGG